MTEYPSANIPESLPRVVREFLGAVANRDVTAVGRCLAPDVRYAFAMPQAPVEGREAVQAVFERVLGTPTKVRWDVVTSAVAGDVVHLERVDRFWFGENEAAIECNGVLRLADDRIAEVRDYTDLGTWRERKAAALGAAAPDS